MRAHTAAGYHQHGPTRQYISTAADNSRNPPVQMRDTTLSARKHLCANGAAATTLPCVGVAYRV